MADNTFLGLQPYTEDDAYRFKGRTEESQELFRLIVRNDFTVCYAESGEGKTSLLNAGVFPLLRENMYFPIAITFTSDDYKVTPDSFDTIIDRCIKDSIAEYNEKNKGVNVEYLLCSSDFQGLNNQAELQRELSKYSWWKLRNYKPQAMGLTFIPVFVFDQFEEVFNLPGSIVWTKKFFDWLEDISSDSCPDVIVKKVREIIGDKAAFPALKEEKGFKAVFSLRKEFIGELDYWGMQTHFIPALKDNRYCLKALTYEGAKKVMTQQERFDEDKVEQVLKHFVGQYSREPERTIAEGLPAIPALLLSVVCDSWEKDMAAFASLDTEEIGQSLNIILERFYNQAIDAIVADLTEQNSNISQEQCRHDLDTAVFFLIDGNGKRVRTKTTTTDLTQIDFDTKYKQALCNHRIIKVTKIEGEDYVEIVHDCLCPIVAKRREVRLTVEAKEREERLLREQAKKMRKRLSFFVLFAIVTIALVAVFLRQQQNTSRAIEESEAYRAKSDSIQELKEVVERQKNELRNDSILLASHLAQILNDSVTLAEKNDSLLRQISINQQQEKIIERLEALSQKEIYNNLPGKLSEQINPEMKYHYTSLSISGGLNMADIALFREMIDEGSLRHIDLENSMIVNDILGDSCFYGCSRLYSVKFPHNVTSIGKYAFYGCRGLTSISIPSSVKSIGADAFHGCRGLTSVTIPSSVKSIGDGAFYDCRGLTSISIPSSVTSIGKHAFSYSSLTSVSIPGSVTSIGDGAFYDCRGLTSVTIPSSVKSIGDNAFQGCRGLTSVTIPSSVTSIGSYAFNGCSSLTSVSIPGSVTSIDNGAFNSCSGLTSITIPNSVTSIGWSVFRRCSGLTSVTIPSSVKSIGDNAFQGCRGLTSVTIPSSVTSIGYGAFSGCSGLTSVTIPSSVKSIGKCAFEDCRGLTSVSIPSSVTSIGDGAFSGCSGLTSVIIALTKPTDSNEEKERLVQHYKSQAWWNKNWKIEFKVE